MSFDWGGFGQGLSVGLERGWNLGEKIAEAMRKRDFKNSVDKAGKDYDTAKQELDAERDRRAAPTDADPGSSLEEVKPMTALPSKFAPSGQLSESATPQRGLTGAIPVESYSSQPEAEMPKQAIRDLPTAMSDNEYQMRSRALMRERQRSYLNARMEYASMDPDKFAEIQKEQFQMDVNDAIRERAEAAMKGDGNAIGQMVGTLQKMGIIPAGKIERDGDNVVLRDPKTGDVIMGGPITPELVRQYIPLYAMAEKALADDNFEKLYQIGKDRRAEGREDQKLALEGRKVAVSEGDLDNKRYATDVNAAYLKAKAMGTGGGSGTAPMSDLPNGTHIEVDPNDPDGQRQLIINTKTKEPMGEWRNRRPYPLTPMTNVEKSNGERLQAEGWIPTIKYDSTGLVKFAMRDPETGDYVFADAPDQVFHEPKPTAIDWPTRGGAGGGNLAGAKTQSGAFGGAVPQGSAGQGSGTNRVEIPVETTDETPAGATDTPQKKAIQVDAVSRAAPTVRGVRKAVETPVAAQKPDTGFNPWEKLSNWWDENSKGRRERVAAQQAKLAAETPKAETTETSAPKVAITQGTAASRTMGDRLKDSQKEAYDDTSLYTDQQLKQINAARARHGEEPRKASGETPKESGFAKVVRQSREKNAAWDARTKFEKEDKERQTAIRDRRRSEKAIGEAKRLKEIMGKAKPSKAPKVDKKLDIDDMVIREGRSKSQQEQAEFYISNRVAWDLREKMEKSDVDIQALTPKKLKGLFSSFGGRAEKASDYFWRTLCKELKEVDRVNTVYKERKDGLMRRAAMKPGIHKREEELRKELQKNG